jgi:hypothetical protein
MGPEYLVEELSVTLGNFKAIWLNPERPRKHGRGKPSSQTRHKKTTLAGGWQLLKSLALSLLYPTRWSNRAASA